MIDLVIVIIFAIFAFLGYQRGLVSSLIGFFGNILALFCAWFLKDSVAAIIDKQFALSAKFGQNLSQIIPMPEDIGSKMANFDALGSFYSWLESTPLPQGVRSQLIESMQESINSLAQAQYATLLDTFAQVVASYLLIGLCFLGLWFILSILIHFCSKFIVTFVHHTPIIGTIDHLGGVIINLALVAIVLAVLYGVLEVTVEVSSLGSGSWFEALSNSKILPALNNLFFAEKL